MIFPKRTRFVCPFCRRVFAKSFSRIRLGPTSRRCKGCGRVFADRSIEWPTASPSDKIEFLFPPRVIVYLTGNIILGVVLGLKDSANRADFLTLMIFGGAIVAVPLVIHLIRCKVQIRDSIIRYQNRVLTDAGYDSARTEEAWQR